VPKAQVLDRNRYEYFGGLSAGQAHWTRDIDGRAVVHTFPRGWVNTKRHPWAWIPSVTYNAPLKLYMMANWGTASAPDGLWFGEPSYLGFWVAKDPWGPWEQIHEEMTWTPQGDIGARAYMPQISPKWLAKDGKSFWLVWSDFQAKASPQEMQQVAEEFKSVRNMAQAVEVYRHLARAMPYYAVNAQRVDLMVAS
jgi:hypothetical protein